MGQPSFRVIDPQRDHPRDLPKRAIKEFRLDRENPERPLPIVNATHSGAPLLSVNEVIKRTQRELPGLEVRPRRYKINPLIGLFLILFSIVGLVLLVNSMR